MKRIFVTFVCVCLCSSTAIAVPNIINYQGSLSDSEGNPIDGTVLMTFRLFNDPYSGSSVWTESNIVVAVNNGLFSVTLGETNPLTPAMFSVPRWLSISVNGDPEIMPRVRFTSHPWSLLSEDSERLDSQEPNYYLQWGNLVNVPSGFADGIDNEGSFTAGNGINISGDEISIAPSGVNGAMIQDGTVTDNDIANNTISGAKITNYTIGDSDIQANSITNFRLSEETGIAYAFNGSPLGVGTSQMTDLLTISITVPSSGYIYLQGSSTARLSGSTAWGYAYLQIDDDQGGTTLTHASSAGAEGFSTSNGKEFSLSPLRVFYVNASGTYTFRLEGMRLGNNGVTFHRSMLVAMYIKTEY